MSWTKAKLKYLADMRSGDTITGELIDSEGQYPVYGGGALRGYTNSFTHDGEYILIGRQGANCGSVREVKGKFYASEHAVVVTHNKNVDNGWLYYVLESMNLNQYSISAAQPGLAVTTIKNLEVSVPSYELQIKIREYIDTKIKTFESIITKKEKLNLLLEQQRQSIITEAVTKGLNPNVKMKDSGVEWIGEIPDAWNTTKLKFVSEMKSGTSIDSIKIDENGEYRVYGGGELRGYTEAFTHDGEYVIVGRQGANCGQATFVLGKFWATEHAVVVSTKKVEANWLYYVLKSMNLNQYSMSAAQPGIAVSTILNLAIPHPTMDEQKEIMNFLTKYDDEMTNIIKNITLQIEKLKEYRQSLIYEAVTGKIDVRELELD